MRSQLLAALILMGVAVVSNSAAQTDETSAGKVKATATASKPGADGKQTVTITLDVEKGWYIYANPVKANSDIFDQNRTVVSFKAKEKAKADVKYPAGKQKIDGKYQFNVYEDRVVIEGQVQRIVGDATPLRISIDVNACRKGECLTPGTIVVTLP